MEISEALKRFRKTINLSQRQLSEKIGVPYQSYQTYEYGTSVPSVKVIKKIAVAFNVSMDYLAGLSDEPRQKPADELLLAEVKHCRDLLQEVLNKAV